MFSKFHGQKFFVIPSDSWGINVIMELSPFFLDLEYGRTEDYAILYDKGLDPVKCITEYVDYAIKYYEDLIGSMSNRDDITDYISIFPELVEGYKKKLAILVKSRMKLEL